MSSDDTRDTLEPTVAAIERARFVIGETPGLDRECADRSLSALEAAQSRIVQLWFGDDSGQDTLFADGL